MPCYDSEMRLLKFTSALLLQFALAAMGMAQANHNAKPATHRSFRHAENSNQRSARSAGKPRHAQSRKLHNRRVN
jgi:hypothetical protein